MRPVKQFGVVSTHSLQNFADYVVEPGLLKVAVADRMGVDEFRRGIPVGAED